MRNAPDFVQIWFKNEWAEFAPRAIYSRAFYKFRSVVRIAIWFPITTLMLMCWISLAAVLG